MGMGYGQPAHDTFGKVMQTKNQNYAYDQQYGQVPYPGANDNHTSVKVHAPPGGKSNFSLGGGYNEVSEESIYANRKNQYQQPP